MSDNEEELQKSYYSVIPATVRYDESLTANAKLMYGEITSLANHLGYCFASNNYFAKLYKVTPQAISKWINLLADRGYINLSYIQKEKTNVERRIYICKIAESKEKRKRTATKRVALTEREPKNDLEKVEKIYLQNYKELYDFGMLKLEQPIINWTQTRKLEKDCIQKYGLETIIDAVRKSKENKFLVSKGYVLSMVLSAGMLSQLINSTDGRIDNDSQVGEIDF